MPDPSSYYEPVPTTDWQPAQPPDRLTALLDQIGPPAVLCVAILLMVATSFALVAVALNRRRARPDRALVAALCSAFLFVGTLVIKPNVLPHNPVLQDWLAHGYASLAAFAVLLVALHAWMTAPK